MTAATATNGHRTLAERLLPWRTPVEKATTRAAATAEIGTTGLKIYSGIVQDEFIPELRSTQKQIAVWREMGDNDPVVAAMLHALVTLMLTSEWQSTPFSDAANHQADAEWLAGCMDDMSHSEALWHRQRLTKLQYGFSFFETVYKYRRGPQRTPADSSKFSDGKLGWRKFAFRSQESLDRWVFDDQDGVQGFVQRKQSGGGGTCTIPIDKAMLFRADPNKGNPQGLSVLRRSYRPWWYKKRLEEIEGIGVERELTGIPVVHIPPEAYENAETLAKYEQLAKDVRVDEQAGVVLPSVYDDNGNDLYRLELLASPGQKAVDTVKILERKALEIALSTLTDVILVGHETTGSYALAISKDELLTQSLNGWLDMDADDFNRHEIPRLFRLNGNVSGELPRFEPTRIKKVDVGKLAEVIKNLALAGLFADEETAQYVMEEAGIPMRSDREMVEDVFVDG